MGSASRAGRRRLGQVVRRASLLLATALLTGTGWAQGVTPRVVVPDAVLDGSEQEPLRWPVAVAVVSEDELAVADAWKPRLLVFRRVGASWGLAQVVPLSAAPAGLAFDGSRYVVALRGGGLMRVGSAGGVEPLAETSSLVVGALANGPAGSVLAYDAANGRVLRLDTNGKRLADVAVDAPVSALAADGAGGFWAAFAEAGEVRRYASQGEVVARFDVPDESPLPAWPVGLALEPGGRLFVLDRHAARLLALDSSGRLVGLGSRHGWDAGQLHFPAALSRLPSGSLVVVDQGNGRLAIFRLLGGIGS